MTLFFVYGTLKRGYGNNRILKHEQVTFKGTAYSQQKYIVEDVGFPIAFPNEMGVPLLGEVYDVNTNYVVHLLDQLESNGSFYTRVQREFVLEDTEEKVTAWIYEIKEPHHNRYRGNCGFNPEKRMWEWKR